MQWCTGRLRLKIKSDGVSQSDNASDTECSPRQKVRDSKVRIDIIALGILAIVGYRRLGPKLRHKIWVLGIFLFCKFFYG